MHSYSSKPSAASPKYQKSHRNSALRSIQQVLWIIGNLCSDNSGIRQEFILAGAFEILLGMKIRVDKGIEFYQKLSLCWALSSLCKEQSNAGMRGRAR
jgi:hypothetical protein